MRYNLKVALLTLGTVAGFACGIHHLRHAGSCLGHGCEAHRSHCCEHGGAGGHEAHSRADQAEHDGTPGAG